MKNTFNIKPIGILLCAVICCNFAQGVTVKDQISLISGTWTRDQITEEGKVRTWTKQIEKVEKAHHFLETITIKNNDGNKPTKRQLHFQVIPVADKFLHFKGIKQRDLNPNKHEKWEPSNISYIFQVDQNFYHELWDLASTSGSFKYRRVGSSTSVIDPSNMDVLKPLLGKFVGEFNNPGSKAYGASKEKSKITSIAELSKTGAVLKMSWIMNQGSDPAEKAFEAHGIYSYNPQVGSIVKQFQTSTGVLMNAVLISSSSNKLLWERNADTPSGKLYEHCLFDFSEPNTFKHVILKRTLNGIPQVNEENETIILKRVK